jgi:transcription elongation factor Elf1
MNCLYCGHTQYRYARKRLDSGLDKVTAVCLNCGNENIVLSIPIEDRYEKPLFQKRHKSLMNTNSA